MKTKFLMLAVMAMVVMTSCNRVASNHEGVLMTNYGQNGRSDYSLVVGNQGVLGPGSELFQVPMHERRIDVEPFDIMDGENSVFSIDPTYLVRPKPGTGVDVIFNYKHVAEDGGDRMVQAICNEVLTPLVLNAYKEVARSYKTDSLMRNMTRFERQVEDSIKSRFSKNFFEMKELTSGLRPPKSMITAIEERNNAKIKAETIQNEQKMALMSLEKARIEQQTNAIKSQGLTKEILQERFIDAIKHSNNRIIITDGRTPIILSHQ